MGLHAIPRTLGILVLLSVFWRDLLGFGGIWIWRDLRDLRRFSGFVEIWRDLWDLRGLAKFGGICGICGILAGFGGRFRDFLGFVTGGAHSPGSMGRPGGGQGPPPRRPNFNLKGWRGHNVHFPRPTNRRFRQFLFRYTPALSPPWNVVLWGGNFPGRRDTCHGLSMPSRCQAFFPAMVDFLTRIFKKKYHCEQNIPVRSYFHAHRQRCRV